VLFGTVGELASLDFLVVWEAEELNALFPEPLPVRLVSLSTVTRAVSSGSSCTLLKINF
jgi:hypothetical protein